MSYHNQVRGELIEKAVGLTLEWSKGAINDSQFISRLLAITSEYVVEISKFDETTKEPRRDSVPPTPNGNGGPKKPPSGK